MKPLTLFAVLLAFAIALHSASSWRTALVMAQEFDQGGFPEPALDIWDGHEAAVQRAIRRSPGGFYGVLTDTLIALDDPTMVTAPLLEGLGIVLPPGVDPIDGVDSRDLNRVISEVTRILGPEAKDAMLEAARGEKDDRD